MKTAARRSVLKCMPKTSSFSRPHRQRQEIAQGQVSMSSKTATSCQILPEVSTLIRDQTRTGTWVSLSSSRHPSASQVENQHWPPLNLTRTVYPTIQQYERCLGLLWT